jgi:8-oxo-dGTP diphosphatase
MPTIAFHSLTALPNERLTFAVIGARYRGKWVFCRQRKRRTYEMPGGHREPGEDITDAAKRELYEETGAVDFALSPICIYSMMDDGKTRYGRLFYAEIHTLGELPESEIAEIVLLEPCRTA